MTMTLEKPDSSPARRPTGVNGWLVVGGVITLLIVGLGALSAAGWLAYRTETQTQTYQTAIDDLDIDLSTGDLRVTVGPSDAVVLTRRLHWSFRKPTFQETFDGQRLTVTQSCGWLGVTGPNCGVDYTLQVPEGTRVRAHTDTGDLTVDDVHGPVDLDTSTGDVAVTGVVGDLSIHSGTGDVTAAAQSTHVNASTDTGDVTLRLTAPPQAVTVDSGTGDVLITVPAGGIYHVDTDTGTGDTTVAVHTSDTAAQTITAHTGTGDIDISYA